jgi:hypothetical protein
MCNFLQLPATPSYLPHILLSTPFSNHINSCWGMLDEEETRKGFWLEDTESRHLEDWVLEMGPVAENWKSKFNVIQKRIREILCRHRYVLWFYCNREFFYQLKNINCQMKAPVIFL